HLRDDMGQRRLAGPWRSGQNHRRQTIRFDRAAQKFSGAENMFLPDKFLEGARPHPSGEGSGSADAFLDFVFSFLKQILHGVKNTKRERRRTLYSRAWGRPLRFYSWSCSRWAWRARRLNCLLARFSKGAIALITWWQRRNRRTGKHCRSGSGRQRLGALSSAPVTK